MSLFDDTPRSSKQSSSLFADASPSARSSGLFADEPSADAESPWSMPTPKKAARRELVKTLLPDVPESYVEIVDALIAEDGSGAGVGSDTVKKVLQESGLGDDESERIVGTVMSGDADKMLGRGEVNVLLALVGLAQEGEDVTLDGVDERRNNLPMPNLGKYTQPKAKAAETPVESGARERSTENAKPDRDNPSPVLPKAGRKQSFGFPDTDPWSAPDLHRGHNHTKTNGSGAPAATTSTAPPQRTTSAFTTHSQPESAAIARSPPTRASASSEGGWGNFGQTGQSEPYRDAGFGEPAGGEGDDPTGLGAPFGPRIAPGADEVITVTALSEKEGMMFFQHRNYQVTSARRNSKVIRRYSDFVWLLDCLHKRYPFRQLPLLPPKRVAINGNYLAADSTFVEKRRRGLARFANALVRHPVLGQEQLVIMFLTVPTELAVWRKQASISVQEEFVGKTLPPTLEDSLPPTLQSLFDRVRTGVRRSSEQYINLCNCLERLVKRNEGMAAEQIRIATSLTTLTSVSADTYAADTSGDIVGLNLGINAVSKHLGSSQSLLEDEARAWDEGVLEDFKRQRDCLVSVRDMFDRRERYDRDNIPQLQKRIKGNEEKLVAIRNKPEGTVKPGEAERVEDAILKDKQSIVDQHARGVFIKECIRDEILHFQNSQYQVSRLQQDWAAERVKYAELQAENWRQLADEVEAMPLGES
ncbi:sorting nexin Mvp1 [Microthyrium microscopicum]|uniref:Sorting nexin MVP1 n=1 Tax=Microthyrium microscopicum TaxID=703497 RepID=A0A6A6TW05_9PEZI|nr:sorting nexin Mvp1 [Microthyrium microscopicum]